MIKLLKTLFLHYHSDDMVREYEVLVFLINDSFTLSDFIYCKKRIKRFQARWHGSDYSYTLLLSKLNKMYDYHLSKQRSNIRSNIYGKQKK